MCIPLTMGFVAAQNLGLEVLLNEQQTPVPNAHPLEIVQDLKGLRLLDSFTQ